MVGGPHRIDEGVLLTLDWRWSGACLRMQVMATHTSAQAQRAAEVIGWACQFATQLLGRTANATAGASASTGV